MTLKNIQNTETIDLIYRSIPNSKNIILNPLIVPFDISKSSIISFTHDSDYIDIIEIENIYLVIFGNNILQITCSTDDFYCCEETLISKLVNHLVKMTVTKLISVQQN